MDAWLLPVMVVRIYDIDLNAVSRGEGAHEHQSPQ